MSEQWDKAALELAGVGAIVMIYRDLHDTIDREHEPTVRRWLTWGGLLSPDGENLTASGEKARRAALRLLAERQVSPARIEALAGGDVARWAAMAERAEADTPAVNLELASTAVPALCAEVARMGAALAELEAKARPYETAVKRYGEEGITDGLRDILGFEAALVTLSSWSCITGRPEDAARAFGALLGDAGESEDGRRGAARALRNVAAVLEGQPVPETTAEQDVDALRREAERGEGVAVNKQKVAPALAAGLDGRGRGIRRALDVLGPHLPPPRGAR